MPDSRHPHYLEEQEALKRLVQIGPGQMISAVDLITQQGSPAALISVPTTNDKGDIEGRVFLVSIRRMSSTVQVKQRPDDKALDMKEDER